MAGNDHFVRFMQVELSGRRPFEELVTKIMLSVISLATGSGEAEKPDRFFGTAFGISLFQPNEPTDIFLTCSHVFDNFKADLNESGDRIKFISVFDNERLVWREVETISRIEPRMIRGDFVETHDISLCKIPGISIPPVTFSDNSYIYGAEVGVLGFPNYEYLQRLDPQPIVLKTVLSGQLVYPLETGNGQATADRLVLGCVTGHGFSGSPVFSIEEGHIIGMLDYAPIENYTWTMTEMNRQQPDRDTEIHINHPGGLSFAVPSSRLQQSMTIIRENISSDHVQSFLREGGRTSC